jgi:transposase
MDVHKESIVVTAVNHDSDRATARFEIPNTDTGVHRLVKRLREMGEVRCAYEAGPCGYELRRFLSSQDISCDVVAPSLIPRKPGDRVKTDRRDAEKLARLHRMGELTAIRVPTPAQEALRDLVRTREDAKEDALRRRHRLQKFLLRQGRRYEGKSWTKVHWNWIRSQTFPDDNAQAVLTEYLVALEQELERIQRLNTKIEEESRRPEIASAVARLRTLRGVDTVTAMTLVSELVDFSRFTTAHELMSFAGLVPSEYSSGGKEFRGRITKTGNAHVRRVLVEAAWHYRHPPTGTGIALRKRREGQPPPVLEIARRAELRLCRKYRKMTSKGKNSRLTVVSVARELAGFVWAIGRSR